MENVYNFYDAKDRRTIKDIGTAEIIQDALNNQINTIAVISSGNYLDALSKEIKRRNIGDKLKIINLVNKSSKNSKLELLIRNKRILRDAQEREEFVKEKIIDAGKVKDYTDFIPKELEEKAGEMLALNPGYISLGVGTGRLFAVLYRKIKEKGLHVKLVGIVPKNENGIFNDGNLVKDEQGNLHYKKFKQKTLADKLSTPYTSYKNEILQSTKEGHLVVEITNRDFKKANKEAVIKSYDAEYSGSAGFVLCNKKIREKYGINDNAKILMINTGKGVSVGYSWFQKMKKPAVVMAASIILAFGIKHGIERYQYDKLEHYSLAQTALIAAEKIGEKINVNKMSVSELDKYITDSKEKIGGPAAYW